MCCEIYAGIKLFPLAVAHGVDAFNFWHAYKVMICSVVVDLMSAVTDDEEVVALVFAMRSAVDDKWILGIHRDGSLLAERGLGVE